MRQIARAHAGAVYQSAIRDVAKVQDGPAGVLLTTREDAAVLARSLKLQLSLLFDGKARGSQYGLGGAQALQISHARSEERVVVSRRRDWQSAPPPPPAPGLLLLTLLGA